MSQILHIEEFIDYDGVQKNIGPMEEDFENNLC